MCSLMQKLVTFYTINLGGDVEYSQAGSLLKTIFTFDETSTVYRLVVDTKDQDEAPDKRLVFFWCVGVIICLIGLSCVCVCHCKMPQAQHMLKAMLELKAVPQGKKVLGACRTHLQPGIDDVQSVISSAWNGSINMTGVLFCLFFFGKGSRQRNKNKKKEKASGRATT